LLQLDIAAQVSTHQQHCHSPSDDEGKWPSGKEGSCGGGQKDIGGKE